MNHDKQTEMYYELQELEQDMTELDGDLKYLQDELDNLDIDSVKRMRDTLVKYERIWIERLEKYERHEEIRKALGTHPVY